MERQILESDWPISLLRNQTHIILICTMSFFCVFLIIVIVLVALHLCRRKVIDLKGKKVLITGSASGIGRMLAGDMVRKVFFSHLFDKQGAIVVLWDINESMLKDTVKELKDIDA